MKRLSVPQLFSLNAYWFGLSFMWNSLHPIILPAALLSLVPEAQKNTYLGLLTFAGLIIAMVVQPISGAWSDRWSSRWGRRRPLIVLGTGFDILFLALIGWAGGLFWLFIGYLGLQFSSNIAHGPMQGLLPDKVPDEQMGAASGIKNLLDMLGLVVASLLAGRLLDPRARNLPVMMLLVIVVLAAPAIFTMLTTKEAPTTRPTGGGASFSLKEFFTIDFSAHTAFWRLILARFFFLLGAYGIQAFAQYYIQDVLAVANPVKTTGDLLASITLALVALSVAGGWLSDRFGARPVMTVACLLAGVGFLLLMLVRTPQMLLVYGMVAGAGIGLFITANWTLANRLAPVEDAGKFMGFTNLATAGSAAVGRLQGPMIDLLNQSAPGKWHGYMALFLFAALAAFVSALILQWVVEKAPAPAQA